MNQTAENKLHDMVLHGRLCYDCAAAKRFYPSTEEAYDLYLKSCGTPLIS